MISICIRSIYVIQKYGIREESHVKRGKLIKGITFFRKKCQLHSAIEVTNIMQDLINKLYAQYARAADCITTERRGCRIQQ